MNKHIIVIGGGISGLAVLHYLKRKYKDSKDTRILLLEKNDRLGGTIRSVVRDGALFETGPNGFLDSKERTLQFVNELGLRECLVPADQESKIRYLSVGDTLHELPSNPQTFLTFKLLSLSEKCRVLGEMFVPREDNPDETVYEFGTRRLGERFAQVFLDPMVSGVYGGDARRANLRAVFPRIHALEQEYGSLIKAMFKARKGGSPTGILTTFREGLSQLINTLGNLYREHIKLGQDVSSVAFEGNRYTVTVAHSGLYHADELFICAPAYGAAPMVKGMNGRLGRALERVDYAPIAVVGLVFPDDHFIKRPHGYGYLIPSSERKEILGVLFESNVFPGRCREGDMFLRVMIGGSGHREILQRTKEELIALAVDEVERLFGRRTGDGRPTTAFFTLFPRAIPQYDGHYCEAAKIINEEQQNIQGLRFVANYIKGVSLNDCIENAYQAVEHSHAHAA